MNNALLTSFDRQSTQHARQSSPGPLFNSSGKTSGYGAELAMDRFGLKVASHLFTGIDNLEHDLSERLRVARQQALAKRKLPALTRAASREPASSVLGGHGTSAVLGGGGNGVDESSLWNRLASFLPLVVLIVGLVAIPSFQNDFRAKEIAEIDAALLTDDLPPAAFTDPGFAEFVKARRASAQ